MSEEKKNQPTPVGVALEKARHRVGFSAEAASMAAGISSRELAHIESGLRLPKPDILKALSRVYGVDHMRFGTGRWVPRVPPRYDAEAGVIWLGYISIAYDRATHGNEHLMRAICGAIRTMRSLDSQMPIFMRKNDFPVLSELLDMTDPELPQLMGHHLNQDAAHVDWLLTELRNSIAAAQQPAAQPAAPVAQFASKLG